MVATKVYDKVGKLSRAKVLAAVAELEQRGERVHYLAVSEVSGLARDYVFRVRRTLVEEGTLDAARWPVGGGVTSNEGMSRALHLIRERTPDTGLSFSVWMSRELGCSTSTVARLRGEMIALGLIREDEWPGRKTGCDEPTERQPGDPTEDEIRARCDAIKAAWTREDWRLRAAHRSARLVAIRTVRVYAVLGGGE